MTLPKPVNPNAKIPLVLLPAAEPQYDADVAAPPALTTSPEYVYLLRVEETPAALPSAKIPKVPSTKAAVILLLKALGDGP